MHREEVEMITSDNILQLRLRITAIASQTLHFEMHVSALASQTSRGALSTRVCHFEWQLFD